MSAVSSFGSGCVPISDSSIGQACRITQQNTHSDGCEKDCLHSRASSILNHQLPGTFIALSQSVAAAKRKKKGGGGPPRGGGWGHRPSELLPPLSGWRGAAISASLRVVASQTHRSLQDGCREMENGTRRDQCLMD